jgi:hypothetical protein
MNRGKVETELRRGPKSAGEGKRNGLEDAAVKQSEVFGARWCELLKGGLRVTEVRGQKSETFGRIVRYADKVGAQRSMKLS